MNSTTQERIAESTIACILFSADTEDEINMIKTIKDKIMKMHNNQNIYFEVISHYPNHPIFKEHNIKSTPSYNIYYEGDFVETITDDIDAHTIIKSIKQLL